VKETVKKGRTGEKGEEKMREIMGEKNSRMRIAHHEEKNLSHARIYPDDGS